MTVSTTAQVNTQNYLEAVKQRSAQFQRLFHLIVDLTGKSLKDSVEKIDWAGIKQSLAEALVPLNDEEILAQASKISGLEPQLVLIKAEINYLYAVKEIQARKQNWKAVFTIKKNIAQLQAQLPVAQ